MQVTLSVLADILSTSKSNIIQRVKSGILSPINLDVVDEKLWQFDLAKLDHISIVHEMLNSNAVNETSTKPLRKYTCIELFAGAGGLAIGLERAGFETILLNEIDKNAAATLVKNRPMWNVINDDISKVDFSSYYNKVDLLSGGFPCQAFSYAGRKLGLEDTRGTLFFEYARAVKESQPKVFLAENVRGLLNHDSGQTFKVIKDIIKEIGYTLVDHDVLKAMFYRVPQKRERLILIGVRNDLVKDIHPFKMPSKHDCVYTLHDAFYKGALFDRDVPESQGQNYPRRKAEILEYVPQGGYWRDLPEELQKEYMQGSFYLGGGKTGMARRLSLDEPSLTLTCAPAQKQTERCHPIETRPLTVREYARIQTFPDDWEFMGSITAQYKQIGNAVPCNLSERVGNSIIAMLNAMEDDKIYSSFISEYGDIKKGALSIESEDDNIKQGSLFF